MSPKRRVKTVDTSFEILEVLKSREGASVSEVSEACGLARSTAFDHLATLESNGFVVNVQGEYHIGLKFLDYGSFARSTKPILTAGEEALTRITDEIEGLAWISVEERGRAVQIAKKRGEKAIQTAASLGQGLPMHCSSPGKAMLAHLPDYRVEEIISQHQLKAFSEQTITDESELKRELEEIRESKIAHSDGEMLSGIRSVASPVVVNGTLMGALSVTAPKNHLDTEIFEEEIPELLRGLANETELRIVQNGSFSIE